MSWQVPKEIMGIIPYEVKGRLPYHGTHLISNRNLDLVDLFAGQARITRWAFCSGLNAITMDKTYSDHMDILELVGLALTVLLVLRNKENGIGSAGPQCSSWVWLNRKVTKRSSQNPLSDSSVKYVRDGNNVSNSMALLCYMCSKLKEQWLIEQLVSSVFLTTVVMRVVSATIPT